LFLGDERGFVKRMLRVDDPIFVKFGEVYFSGCNANAVKAWHLHKRMILNYAVVVGRVLIGLADFRPHSLTYGATDRIILGDKPPEYGVLTIPPGIWNGYRALEGMAVIANCASEAMSPDEIERRLPSEFLTEFDWGPFEVAG
jgi:dTDP-4-dehydrorhamnose 3,5-epimerase